MNEKTDLQIKNEFALKRIRQRISYFFYLVLLLLVFLFRETGNLVMVFLGIFAIYSFVYLVYFQYNWRCPSCNNHLDRFFSKKLGVNPFFHSKIVHCPYCEKQLR